MFLLSGINHVVGVFCSGSACDANPVSRLLKMSASSSVVKAIIFTAGLIEIAGASMVILAPALDEEKQKQSRFYGAWTLLIFTVAATLIIKVTALMRNPGPASGLYVRLIPILSNISVGGGLYLLTQIP